MRDFDERPPFDPDVITRYLAGQCTPDEVDAVTRWSAGDHERTAVLERLHAAWTAARPAEIPVRDHEAFMSDLRARIHAASLAPSFVAGQTVAHGRTVRDAPLRSRWSRALRSWGGIAAGVAIAVAGVVFVARRSSDTNRGATASRARQYVTGAGQRAEITLDDGTTATLAPLSSMSVAGHVVTLRGEAFFTMRHHAADPWIVRTGAVQTRVLGTAFDVRRYAGDGATRVIVTEGKVSTGGRMTAPVVAGMIAYVTDSTVRSEVGTDNAALTSWTRGRLVFHNAPVADVLSAVSQWYGVTIHVSDPALSRQLLTAELDVQRSRSEFIAALEVVLDVQVSAVGDTLLMTPRSTRTIRGTPERGGATPFTPRTEVGR